MHDYMVHVGDIVRLSPKDPIFWMMTTGMVMVDQIVLPDVIITVDGNVFNMNAFDVVYINGKTFY
jgi:hypothetical protein